MHIIHIASEIAPAARVGGLADVILGLGRELLRQGHQVTLILPKYASLELKYIESLSLLNEEVSSYWKGRECANRIWIGKTGGLKVIFIDPEEPFFQRETIYGYEDDIDRFLYFSRAALDFLVKKALKPDVIHLHEWQTAAIAPLAKTIYASRVKSKVVLTMHNLEYQGLCSQFNLQDIGLNTAFPDNKHPHLMNILKGGIMYADSLNTVSPTYSRQVLTEQYGFNLHTTLLQYQDKFSGILNGLDYHFWNPAEDVFLPIQYTSDESLFEKKQMAKMALRQRLGLAEDNRPIIGCVTRLVPQKGLDLIKHTLSYSLANDAQFVLLGSTSNSKVQEEFASLKRKYHNHPNVHLILQHQEELVHQIFAGSDIMIVPSLFEPCGLTQLIALRYGSVPIVHKTGGLADTIHDVDYSGKPFAETNGYSFDAAEISKLEEALGRALKCQKSEPGKWRQLILNGMQQDFSWSRPVLKYLDLYREVKYS